MKIFVVDTNVFVSAFITPHGASARFIGEMLENKFSIAFDNRIIAEYIEVLSRPKFGLSEEDIGFVKASVLLQEKLSPIFVSDELPDEDDKMFIEVALASRDKIIVTGNAKHYPPKLMKKLGITIFSPSDALKFFQ